MKFGVLHPELMRDRPKRVIAVKLVEFFKVENCVVAAMLCSIDVVVIDVNAVSEGRFLPKIHGFHGVLPPSFTVIIIA